MGVCLGEKQPIRTTSNDLRICGQLGDGLAVDVVGLGQRTQNLSSLMAAIGINEDRAGFRTVKGFGF